MDAYHTNTKLWQNIMQDLEDRTTDDNTEIIPSILATTFVKMILLRCHFIVYRVLW